MILRYYFSSVKATTHCGLLFLSVAAYTQLCPCSRLLWAQGLVWAPTHFTTLTWILTPQPSDTIAWLRSQNNTWTCSFLINNNSMTLTLSVQQHCYPSIFSLCIDISLSICLFLFNYNYLFIYVLLCVYSSTKRLRFIPKVPKSSSLTKPSSATTDMVCLFLTIAVSSWHTHKFCFKLIF